METYFVGTIVHDGSEFEQCAITNLSTSGAELTRFFVNWLPNRFELKLASDLLISAKVIWKDDRRVGIEFDYARSAGR